MHDFRSSLEREAELSRLPWINKAYQRFFSTTHDVGFVTGSDQRRGMDKVVRLQTQPGYVVIEEKLREQVYDDFLFEIYANVDKLIYGWSMKRIEADYLAYWFVPTRMCYVFSSTLVQVCLWHNLNQWSEWARKKQRGFSVVDAVNVGYVTRSIAVPKKVLLEATWHRMIRGHVV